MSSKTAVYMKKMKEEHPEQYEEYLQKQREKSKKRREEKKRKWVEEPHTPAMIEEREREKKANREKNRRHYANKKSTKRTTRAASTATPEPTPRRCLTEMSEEEARAHKTAQRREQRARQSHQKTTALRKKNTERMRPLRLRNFASEAYYLKAEVSRVLPHKRYATKKGPEYMMTVTIKLAHKMFCDEIRHKVSLSLFAKLRPRNVRKLGGVTVETCLCIYCTNKVQINSAAESDKVSP
ncbi:hypothetical protein RRG08_052617 [Elysia crispata]|uniref:Uncharacterized protein n=1 Tax=Elysia crispata TaxID=231223 RepID=A0AAE1AFR2_9GAST|nr:hypothetical protein RRG08_052617 [Elysia crispata]